MAQAENPDQEHPTAAPRDVLELVARFDRQLSAYKSGLYNEAQLRQEFLNPFFKGLGWDMDNEQGYAEAYKDVIHEDAIRIGGAVKAPDYCFRIGGTRKFFLEAKKPSVCIKDEPTAAYQLRRYAYTAKLPLSILCDFEEFAVYDCRAKPHKDDPAAEARVFYCTFRDFAEQWDWIASIFSRDAVLKGSFDRYAESTKGKRGTSEFDQDFLATIEGWRLELARNLALRNPKLTQRELNFAVQRIIDRIIFLRICEDRGIEDYGRLQALVNGDRIYPRLCQLFEAADARYNSGLFHFQPEKGRHEAPDELTLGLELDDRLLREILHGLYYPDSPYEFSVLSADILGQVYEQFLGKVIRLTEGHRAVVDDKPEVKKAGGVYYTPTYIVDYIVRQTVGKLVEGKTPRQVEKLRILDPACGSGSFLIGAYQFLLDWHLQFYVAGEPEKFAKGGRPALVQTTKGWRLTIAERKRILLNNIYGVDIDTQAVEVTKLSLLLKVLEGETGQSLQTIFRLFQERALPDLGDNIKCGNSLIGPDFYQQSELPFLTDEERYRINVFDWHAEFPLIFRRKSSAGELRETAAASPLDYTMPGVPLHGSYSRKPKKGEKPAPPPPMEPEWEGGFDAVIGNPPYIFTRELLSKAERQYFSDHFKLSWEKHNTFMLFMEMLLRMLKVSGCGGYIVPNSWLTIESGHLLREKYIKRLQSVADLNYAVFHHVSMEPCIFTASGRDTESHVAVLRAGSKDEFLTLAPAKLNRAVWSGAGYRIVLASSTRIAQVLDRVKRNSCPVESRFQVRTGLQAYERGKGTPPQTERDVREHVFDRTKRENEHSVRYLEGRDVARHGLSWSGMWMQYGPWLSQPRDIGIFTRPRVLVREITAPLPYCLCAAFTTDQYLNNKSILNVVHPHDSADQLKALACVLNSRLVSVFYKNLAVKGARKIFPKVVIKNLREFPFPRSIDIATMRRLVILADMAKALRVQLAAVRTPQEQTALERQITATDSQIDRLVYDLYGLTEDEIKIVEGPVK